MGICVHCVCVVCLSHQLEQSDGLPADGLEVCGAVGHVGHLGHRGGVRVQHCQHLLGRLLLAAHTRAGRALAEVRHHHLHRLPAPPAKQTTHSPRVSGRSGEGKGRVRGWVPEEEDPWRVGEGLEDGVHVGHERRLELDEEVLVGVGAAHDPHHVPQQLDQLLLTTPAHRPKGRASARGQGQKLCGSMQHR